MSEDDNQEYDLVVSFYIDTEAYSARDKHMFTCGVEFQMAYQCIKDRRDWCQCIHTENESRVRMLCGKLGVPVKMERVCDTWTHCEIPASTLI